MFGGGENLFDRASLVMIKASLLLMDNGHRCRTRCGRSSSILSADFPAAARHERIGFFVSKVH